MKNHSYTSAILSTEFFLVIILARDRNSKRAADIWARGARTTYLDKCDFPPAGIHVGTHSSNLPVYPHRYQSSYHYWQHTHSCHIVPWVHLASCHSHFSDHILCPVRYRVQCHSQIPSYDHTVDVECLKRTNSLGITTGDTQEVSAGCWKEEEEEEDEGSLLLFYMKNP